VERLEATDPRNLVRISIRHRSRSPMKRFV
jgi:hypothetical protein